jgi:hypothetical protein
VELQSTLARQLFVAGWAGKLRLATFVSLFHFVAMPILIDFAGIARFIGEEVWVPVANPVKSNLVKWTSLHQQSAPPA